ncbi:MAG: GAF domain-containing protein [Deltaproteobacteria bacterium]|nr:GAF domain-containing protein [Deltaproteobacteria bacterium]
MAKQAERLRQPRPRTGASSRTKGRRSEDFDFRDLFENANDIVILNDRGGCIVMANRAAREFGGYSAEEVKRGVDLKEVLAPEEYEAAMILTQRALDGLPIPEVYERHAVLRDGRRRIVELRSNVLRNRSGEPLLQTIGRDVTESRHAAAFQASLAEVLRALLTAQGLDAASKVICDEALRVLEVDGVYLFLPSADEVVGAASAGAGAERFKGLRRSLNDSFVGKIFRRSDPLVANDFPSIYPGLELARGIDIRSLLAVPLRSSGATLGLLAFIHCHDPQYFVGEVCDRALIFAAQTAVAIESALARDREEEEGQVSAALLHVARAIRESLKEAEVVSQIAGSARSVLGCDWTFVSLWEDERKLFRVVATEGFTPEASEEMQLVEFHLKDFPETQELRADQPVEYPEPPAHAAMLFERWGGSSMLTQPISRGGAMIGTLAAGYRKRRGAFPARERRIIEGIAAQAAVALDNARLVEDLRRANDMKSEFLGTMSHELRTPLAAIIGYADLMREGVMGPLQPQQDQVLDRMLINGRSLLDLINTTLDVNRLESGRVAVEVSSFALNDLFTELRMELTARPSKEVVPVIWPVLQRPIVVRTDRGKLKVILRNLLENALKFTAEGSVSVSVSPGSSEQRVQLAVSDTGIGIPPQEQKVIFEMFRQVEGARDRSRSGVGLGLYLVRRYAQLLGGEVAVESSPGLGSKFKLDIPISLGE